MHPVKVAYMLGCQCAVAQFDKTAVMFEAQGAIQGLKHLGGRVANLFRRAPKALEQASASTGAATRTPIVEHVTRRGGVSPLGEPIASSATPASGTAARTPIIENVSRGRRPSPLGEPAASASPTSAPIVQNPAGPSDIGPKIRQRMSDQKPSWLRKAWENPTGRAALVGGGALGTAAGGYALGHTPEPTWAQHARGILPF